MSYEDYSSYADLAELGGEEFLLGMVVILGIMACVMFFAWLITLYPRYYMVKTSGIGPTWSAFIPVWQDIQFFKLAGWPWWSYWAYLGGFTVLSMIPIVRVIAPIGLTVFLCFLYWRVSANFGLGTAGKILSLFLGFWVYWYVALAKKPYVGIYRAGYAPAQYNNNQNWYQTNQQQQDNSWYQQTPQQGYQQPTQPAQPQPQQDWYQQNNNPQQ